MVTVLYSSKDFIRHPSPGLAEWQTLAFFPEPLKSITQMRVDVALRYFALYQDSTLKAMAAMGMKQREANVMAISEVKLYGTRGECLFEGEGLKLFM